MHVFFKASQPSHAHDESIFPYEYPYHTYMCLYSIPRVHKRREGVRVCNFDLFGNTQNLPRVLVVEAFLRMCFACSTITHLLSKALGMAGSL